MPIYEYVCSACEHEFETLQSFSEDPLLFCPECGKEALNKKISAAAFHLKGTGWYETDFKDKKKDDGAEAKSDKGDKDSKDGKDSKKSDTSSSDSKSSGSDDSAGKSKKKAKSVDKKSDGGGKSKPGGSRQSAA